jgi:hypothetical protein
MAKFKMEQKLSIVPARQKAEGQKGNMRDRSVYRLSGYRKKKRDSISAVPLSLF